MPLTSEELTSAVGYLRALLSDRQGRLNGGTQLDYTAKKDAVLAVQERYPQISDDQMHEIMQRAGDE